MIFYFEPFRLPFTRLMCNKATLNRQREHALCASVCVYWCIVRNISSVRCVSATGAAAVAAFTASTALYLKRHRESRTSVWWQYVRSCVAYFNFYAFLSVSVSHIRSLSLSRRLLFTFVSVIFAVVSLTRHLFIFFFFCFSRYFCCETATHVSSVCVCYACAVRHYFNFAFFFFFVYLCRSPFPFDARRQ